jgi:hypothetical protein
MLLVYVAAMLLMITLGPALVLGWPRIRRRQADRIQSLRDYTGQPGWHGVVAAWFASLGVTNQLSAAILLG